MIYLWQFICGSLWTTDCPRQCRLCFGVKSRCVLGMSGRQHRHVSSLSGVSVVSPLPADTTQPTHLQLRVPHHVRRCSYYHHVLHCTPLCTSFHLHDSYHQHFLNESFHFPPTASLFTTTSDFMLLLFTAPLLNATTNCHLHICISVVLLVHLLFFSHHTACSS